MAVALAATGAYLAYGTRTSSALGVPSGVAAGDVVLAYLYADGSTPQITPPAGFAELTFSPPPTLDSPAMTVHVYWKRATGADSGSYTFTHSASGTQGLALRFTGCDPAGTPVQVLGAASRASSGTTAPAVSGTTSRDGEMLSYVAFVYAATTWTSMSGWTDVQNGDGEYNAVKVQATAGATGSIAATAAAANAEIAALVGLLPPPASLTITLTDAGSGADSVLGSQLTVVALGDEAAAGSESLLVSSPAPLPEAASGADALAVTVAPVKTVADSGAAADAVAVSATAGAADAGHGAETVAVTARVPLSDKGTGADSLTRVIVTTAHLVTTGVLASRTGTTELTGQAATAVLAARTGTAVLNLNT